MTPRRIGSSGDKTSGGLHCLQRMGKKPEHYPEAQHDSFHWINEMPGHLGFTQCDAAVPRMRVVGYRRKTSLLRMDQEPTVLLNLGGRCWLKRLYQLVALHHLFWSKAGLQFGERLNGGDLPLIRGQRQPLVRLNQIPLHSVCP